MKVKKKVKIRKKQETIKNREWERERRGKLNVAFGQLDRLLPDHDPSQARSKVAVLLAAIGHIGHLHQVVATLSGQGGKDASQRDSVYVAELARLHERIDTLRARCQQLAQLLQMADIPVPAKSAPRAAKEPGVQIKWNGNIAHKTVQRRIINSRKDKVEKKENKLLPEVGSTAAKKKQQHQQKTIPNTTKAAEEPPTTSDHEESTYLSPVKNVIDLCNTPLRELTGFTLNSASVVASSSSSTPPPPPPPSSSSTSSSISSPTSSLSSSSPAMPDTPINNIINDGQSSRMKDQVKDVAQSVMTSSAGDVAVETTNDMMSSTKVIALETKDVMSLSAGNEQNAIKPLTGLESVADGLITNQSSNSQPVPLGVVTPKLSSTVAVTTATVAVTTSSTGAVAMSSVVVSCSSGLGSSKSIEDESNCTPSNPATNYPPIVTLVPKKSASSKSRPKTVTASGSKPVMVTTAGKSSNPVPVTGTVHVMNSMNPYPSIMPVTVTNGSLNFAAPTQSIMIVLPDGRVVSVPQQQPIQQQFVINRTINHQSPTTIVIGNSAPVIEPIVFEAAADGITVNRAGQKRVLLSKQSNKVPIPMVGTQFVVRRSVEMQMKEKRVIIEKQQKRKKVKKPAGDASTKVDDDVNIPAAVETAKDKAENTVIASDESKKQQDDVKSSNDASKMDNDEPGNKTNKDDGINQTNPSDGNDTSTVKVLDNSGVPKELSTNQPAGSQISQNSIKSTRQDSSIGTPASGTDAEAVPECSVLEVKKDNRASSTVAEGGSLTTTTKTEKTGLASRTLTSKPIQEVQEKLGDKDVSLEVITADNKRQQDSVGLIEKVQNLGNQQNSAVEEVRNLDIDGIGLNIGDKKYDHDDDNDHFGLDTMSNDNDDDDVTEHDRNVNSLMATSQMKRPADSDEGPTTSKKMKTAEEQSISAKMDFAHEDVLQQENFNMAAVEQLISSNAGDVQMVSVCAADVSFQKSSNPSLKVKVDMQHNPNIEQRKLESSKNENHPSNCGGSVLEKDMIVPIGNKDCPIANQKEEILSSVVPKQIEMKLVGKLNQKPVGLLLQDNGNTFAASKNPDTHQVLFGTQLENVITNKCNEEMMADECFKRDSVGEYGHKVSNNPPTNLPQILSLVPAATGFNKLPNRPIIGNVAEIDCILSAGTDQNPKIASHSDKDTIKEVACSSNTSSYPHHSTENPTNDDLVMENVPPVIISSCGMSKESIKPSGDFSMVPANSVTEALPTNTENSLETFVRESNFSESGMFLLLVVNKESLRVAENTQANENATKQNIQAIEKQRTDQIVTNNNNFAMEVSSNQIVKSSFIGGDTKQHKIETQTQTLIDNKTNNSFGSLQQVGINNVFSCSIVNREHQCRRPMESKIMASNSQTQIGSSFDSKMRTISSNYINTSLPETRNLFWNNSAEQVIGSQAGSSSTSMFTNPATNQNLLKSSESGVGVHSFMNYSNTIPTSTTSVASTSSICTSSGVLPKFSMSMFTSAAANQNVINTSNLNLLKSSESAAGSIFMNYSNSISTSTITTSITSTETTYPVSTSSSVVPNFSNKTSITPCSGSTNKLSIITKQRPIVSYKISDSGQKTVNSNPVSNVQQNRSSEKQWNSKMKFSETAKLGKVGVGNTSELNYFQLDYASVVKQCDNCNNYSHNKPLDVHECQHHQLHQRFQKASQNRTFVNTSKTIQSGEITKTTIVHNPATKMIGNKMKKDMSTNTSSEQPKVLYGSQKTYVGNNPPDIARKKLETMDGISSDKNKDPNKNVRKVLKKTVSQQTDDLNSGSMISGSNVGKTDMRRVAGGYKMKSTSSCQTVESATTKINSCEKYPNSFGRGAAQNKRKAATFQAGYNTGLVVQTGGKSTMQVGSSAVTNNKKLAARSVPAVDTLLQNHNNMEIMSSLVPTSTQNSLIPVQHSKSAEKQAAMFVSKNQESKNVKKEEFKTVSQLPKDKNAAFLDDIRLVLPNSDFSNDIFSTLQVPSGSQHHGSLSPTAAFLDAFPLVSNSKNSELLIDSENNDAVHHASETLLQLGDTGESNILDTNITGRQPNQNCLQSLNTYNSSNIAGAHLGMNNDELAKTPCNKNNNSLHSSQLKTGSSTVSGSNSSLPHQQLQTSSHSISVLNATKTTEDKCTEQTSKIQDYQSHHNIQYDYLSANSFQNYNYNSGYKKVVPKFAESNYTGSAPAGINNTGFATNSQQFRDMNRMASTNYGQTNEGGLNYNTYSNWNPKPAMQLQNFDDFQTNYMSGYNNHFPTSTSAPKNVFTSDPSFSTTSSGMFGNLSAYKSMGTSATGNDSSGFVSQSLPVAAVSGKKLGGKSSISDAPANFIYTQASTSSNPVTTRSYSCVFSSASDFQASVGFPQPFYSSSTVCAIDDPLNTQKVTAAKDTGPGQCISTVVTSSAVPIPTKSVNSSKSNSSNKFFPGANNTLGKKQPAIFDNSLNKTNQIPGIDHQSNATTSKSSSYFPSMPTTLNNNFSNNPNSTLFIGQSSYQTDGVFSSSSSGAITTTTLANSKDGSSELVKMSTSTSSQPRMPVNWMTMPDPRTSTLEVASSSASTASFIPPDRMFTPHKDVLDFIAPIITGCGNLQPTYSAINNNSQMFYGLDFPVSDGQQPCGADVSNTKPTTSTTANHQMQTSSSASSSLHYSWPTSKSSLSLLSHLDNHGLGIPSTLPTLVGDLALGTNTGPSTPAADGGYRVSSNMAANIFQTLPEVEERSNQPQSKPLNVSSDVPVKSSNYGLDLQPKSSSSFSTEVQSKSSNYSNAPSKPSNFFNVQSKSSNFSDTPAKSSNFHPDMPSKSSNYLSAPSKPSNFFDVQSKSSNYPDAPSKSSNFTVDGQSNTTMLQFDRNNGAKILESSKNGKNQTQNLGQRSSVTGSSKMSASNHSQQSGGGGSFLSVSQLVDQVKTNKKQESTDNGNTYKYMQNIMPPDIYYPEISTNSGKESGYKCNATQQKGVKNIFQTPINSKNANNPQTAQNRDSYNLLPFDGSTTNQKQNLLTFDPRATNQKQNFLSFDGGTTNQKQNLLPFNSNANQKPKEALTSQKSVVNTTTRKSESMMQNNYNDLSSSFLTPSSTSSFMTTNSTSFVTTSLITTNSTSFMTTNSTLPIPVSMPSTASLWPQTSSNCGNNNSCPTMKKTDGFSTRPSSTYKGSNKYSAESLISSDRFVQDPTPNTDHFSTSTLNFGTCFEAAGHNSTELPSFGTSSTTLFGSSDYHHGDYGTMQNNQPMPSYQNYFGQTLDNLQPPNPSGFLADSADFQMNLFDSTTPYLFPAPSVPALNKKSTNTNNAMAVEPKSNLKTNQKPANNSIPASTGVFYPSTTMSLAPPSTNQHYQKSNSNFPPAPNCSSAANLPLSSSTTNSLANFNMSTIFPEMDDKVDAASGGANCHHHHMSQQSPAAAAASAVVAPQPAVLQQQQGETATGDTKSAAAAATITTATNR